MSRINRIAGFGRLEKGKSRTYELVDQAAVLGRLFSPVAMDETDSFVEFSIRGANVLRYHHGIMPPPPGNSRLYERSGFIHPLWSPLGSVLTTIHPEDHAA